jgi:hypothetical protein
MKEWTFLEAYDYIKANPKDFILCNDGEELSGKRNCICVYQHFKEEEVGGAFAGKLRWRTVDTNEPSVDEELQNYLNEHFGVLIK